MISFKMEYVHSVNILFIFVFVLILSKELFFYFKINKKTIDNKGANLLGQLSNIVLIQFAIFLWQTSVYRHILDFPVGMLFFLFYGPYILMLIHYFFPKDKGRTVISLYTKDFYYAFLLFVLFSSVSFYVIDDLEIDNVVLYWTICFFVVLHLFYYAVKGMFLLRQTRNKIQKKRSNLISLLKNISYLNSFLFAFCIVVLVSVLFLETNYEAFFVLGIFYLVWFYVIIDLIRWRLSNNTYCKEDSTEVYFVKESFVEGLNLVEQKTKLEYNKTDTVKKNSSLEDKMGNDQDKRYEKIRLSDNVLKDIDTRVKKVLNEERAYLDSNFKMTDLANKLKTSRYYLSQYFTYVHGMGFKDYINSLRINEVLLYINKEEESIKITSKELFLLSAFNSKASFYQSFKKITGMTPNEYLKNHNKK
ncbi:helix-turn-helix transcriptional regulator [Myroides odoratimimus]|uniref:helix-turn-helix domain-containing protein n=1 Tax=Myroides odoratimimus TaxID=76832 RepID=UPI002578BBCE|nr:AraC family transcriptional regulator [Myroides odoratimimus]MDM1398918.1 helix-turn-helix transcriptional regulator [Myroides odoratimimus]